MHLILLVLGVLTALTGIVMVGYGIPYNEFGLGNALIVAGTTAIVGGLVQIGIAVAVRQLQAFVEAAEMRAAPRTLGTASTAAARGRAVAKADAVGSKPSPGAAARHAPPPDPRAAYRGDDGALPTPEMAASRAGAHGRSDTPAGAPPSAEDAPETLAAERSQRHYPEDTTSSAGPEAGSADRRHPEEPEGREGSVDRQPPSPNADPRHPRGFDAIWPPGTALRSRASRSDAAVAESDERRQAEPARPSREPRAISVLKSGVIDGMAYSLYNDGSIEAELPQGTLRFASIDELRDYLANKG